MTAGCLLCRGSEADAELGCVEVWQDDHWRVATSLEAEVPGFSYLIPKRHVPSIADLGEEEARTFGEVLAKVTAVLRDATGSELVYVYVFGGGIPHLHVHLAPHSTGDALNESMIRGELVEEHLPNGLTRLVSAEFPPLPRVELRATAERIRGRLAD